LNLGVLIDLVVQQMKRHTKNIQAQFIDETKVLEAEEIFTNLFRKVTLDELLATFVECASTVCASGVRIECRTL